MKPITKLSDIIGLTLHSVYSDDSQIVFTMTDGNIVRMHHHQNCCEHVEIEDIDGDLEDMVGGVFNQFDEVISNELEPAEKLKRAILDIEEQNGDSSETWTFYRISTSKASVCIRWYGTSNGYYSETVDIDVKNIDPEMSWNKWLSIN